MDQKENTGHSNFIWHEGVGAMNAIGEIKFYGRTLTVYNSWRSPLFLASEVSEFLGYNPKNVGRMIRGIDHDLKVLVNISGDRSNTTRGGRHNTRKWFVTEYGLYTVLSVSRSVIAKPFIGYVCDEIEAFRRRIS